ncbi:MAG: acyl-CoA dehydrogenase family protein [Myxococcota bacterium]
MGEQGLSLLDVLGRDAGLEPVSNLAEAWALYRDGRSSGHAPFEAAVSAASQVDRLAFAFSVGYPAALERMVPGVDFPAALCVTEAKGNTPRSTETSLEADGSDNRLRGTKSFVTFGNLATTLIVSARIGERPDGRPDIAVVRVPANRQGVTLQKLPDTPFVPEVPHAAVRFENVSVSSTERLPGDGYLGYVKPFRTIEDIHVVGATLGYLLGLARRTGGASVLAAELSANLLSLDRLRIAEPLDPRVHVALHGVYESVGRLIGGQMFAALLAAAPAAERDRWERDQALLRVASKARAARFETAQKVLG